MTSTLQTVLPDDLETALTNFVGQGSIDSKATLDAAIIDLLDALQSANVDVASLLNALTYKVKGLLEVVIASRNEAAFTFRSRVLKTLQKSTQYPHPIFITCTERIGAFLISVPPWIPLDQNIMAKHHSFSENLMYTNTPESDYFVNNKVEPEQPAPISPTKSTQSGKRHRRASSVSSTIQDPGRYPTKSRRESVGVLNQPPSPTVATNRFGTGSALLDQLKGCLEAYFTACMEDGVEEFAVTNLFEVLVPAAVTPPLQKALAETILESSQFLDQDHAQSMTKATSQSTVAFHDIVKYLGDATKPKLGQWPVVVSQRAIKHVRKYIARDKETFARIEEAIRELAMGSFSTSNHANLINHDDGIPIFAADVGKSLRLLYHIDFGAPRNPRVESQFIRIFGVFSHAETDLRFWKAVSAQLGRRGKEYILRCKTGAGAPVPYRKSTGAFAPQLYPPLKASQWGEHGADIEIDESYRLELHRILSLEKFVPLSQTFFDAIQRFTETSFMFSVSGPENQIIMHPSSCLVLGRSGTGKTTCMLFRIIGLDIAAKKSGHTLRQVFVTQSRTLARRVRLDCLQFRQAEMDAADSSTQKPALGLSLLDMDENAEEEGVLPSKFSELDDSHFPLFLTYDQLCKLVAADFDLQFQPSPLPTPKNARTRAKQSKIMQPLISFDYFDSEVWPHFNQQLKKGLHSALVYSEFMGAIKGSADALSSVRGYLGRADYEQHRNRSIFEDDTDRSKIYTLFEAYQKLRPPKSYDVADRVQTLMASLRDRGVPGKCIDFLYVDEAQDNLIIDAALLRTLCPNPHGLFFAGDTAQTISVGSAFRFNELKDFLYRLERNDIHVRGGSRPPVDPNFFQLSTNYRSHSGIVNAAAFIVKLLDSYFKHSIDTLAPEVAHVDVDIHKPTFFSNTTNLVEFETLISEPLSNTIGLGARQVIIVRHESAANTLRAAIGRVAVVLTLYESKGMEFNDVLLFNFFTDSPATATDWRAMFLAQNEGRKFDHRRHSILQSELKSLYVGLTRARERVWIWEESDKGYPIEALLATSNLATVHAGETIPMIGVSNRDEEWAEQAQQYFAKNLFSEAAFCFQRAHMPWWMTVAQTYKDRQEATRLSEKDPSRSPKFYEIAQTFEQLAKEGQLKEDEESLRLLFANAGECYAVVPDYLSAAVAFLNARKYTAAAYHYRMAEFFDEALDVVKRYPVDPDVAESIKYAAKFVYTKRKDEFLLHKAWKLCDSKEEYLDFLLDHGFGEQRIVFLESITEHEKIAQVLWEAGDYVNAVLRFRQSDDPSSPRQASRCILEGIRSNVPLGTGYGNESDVLSELFKLSRTAILTPEEKAEITFLRAVAHLDSVQLKRYGQHFLDKQDLRGALLALDAWSQSGTLDAMKSMCDNEVADALLLCQKFGTVINTLVRTPGFVDLHGIQPIFGVCNTSSNDSARQPQSQEITLQRTVQPCSFVHSLAFVLVNRGDQPRSRTDPVSLPTNSVDDMIRRALLRRLNAVVERVDEVARKSRGFELCQQFLINQRCGGRDEGSCWKDHVMERDLTIERFNSQFRLHILVISVLNHFTATPGTSDEKVRSVKQRIWLSKLFALCYPSTPKVGSLSDITAALIPEYSWAMPIVQSWLHEVFRSLRPANQVKYFLTNMLITSLLATAFEYSEAVTYLWRGQWSLDPAFAFQNGLIQSNTKPAVGSAIVWLAKGTPTRINLGIHFLDHVLNTDQVQVHLDAEVAVVFAEEVCAQLILNHYAHNYTGYDYLAMPRSWIIRAFARAQSLQVNGSVAWRFATVLDTFLNILLLKKSAGKLQIRGSTLREVSYAVRSQAIQRICRCLSLIGQNITGVRPTVLGILKGLGTVSPPRPEFQRFAQANDWDEVLDALVESTKASAMDELVMIRRDVGYPSIRPRFKPVVCPDERNILAKLRLTQYPPTIALQSENLCPGASQIGSEKQGTGLPGKSVPKNPVAEAPQLESVASTPEDRRSASIIQAFFRRHRRRAGGPIAAAFERLATKLKERTLGYGVERCLVLCIRGPLPHVLAYIETLKKLSEATIQTLNQRMQKGSHEDIEELHTKGIEVRRIRDAAIRLTKELQPSSNLYFNRRSATPVFVFEIVEKVKQIPELVRSIQDFVDCPEDLDYELGVEPILSHRGPWASEIPTSAAGNYVDAVLRLAQSADHSSRRRASQYILGEIRSNVPLGTCYGNESDLLSTLFKLSQTVILTPDEKAEIRFLRAVVNLDLAELRWYGQHFFEKQDLRGALLALDAWTQSATLNDMKSAGDEEVADVLLLCQKFGTVIDTLARTHGFVDIPGIQHIFGVSNAFSNKPTRELQSQHTPPQRTVRPCSFIHGLAFILVNRGEQPRSRADPISLPTSIVDDIIQRALLRRLNAVVERVDKLARKSRAFEICNQFLVNQQCGGHHDGSCWRDHVLEKDITIEKLNSRFRLHILVIAVLNHFTVLFGAFDERTRLTTQKIWITKLFQLCYPPTNKFGCLSDITPALIPEYSLAMPVVQRWLREVFCGLRPADQVKYFLTNILITSLLATAFDYSESVTYLWRGQWSLDSVYAFQNGLIEAGRKNVPVAGSAIIWFAKGTPTRANIGIYFLTHVLNTEVHLDAEVAVAFAEEVCAQLILNHYAHSSTRYDYLTMPRSWIIRAFARAESPGVNGTLPWRLAANLDTFLSILLLRQSSGKLQMRGSVLGEVSLAVRSQAVQRICRCLALIGQNITSTRAAVLGIFEKLAIGSPLRPEFQRFADATDWDEVLDALVESTQPSTMDELLKIRRDVEYRSFRPRFKTAVCCKERDILDKLRLTQYPPAIALQSDILCPGANQIGSEKQQGEVSGNGTGNWLVGPPRLEDVASAPEYRRSAFIIQAFFRRHGRRAGGPIAAIFERLAQKLMKRTQNHKLERPLLLCLRGPLPHVLAYLRTLKNISEDTVQSLDRETQESSREGVEELPGKGVEVGRLRDAIIRLGKELQPSSNLYFNRLSATPVSVPEIVEKVRQVPELVGNLRNFVDCPEDLDYELGVEPILSDRGPWAL